MPATPSEPLPLPHRSRPSPKTQQLKSRRYLTTKQGGGVGVRASPRKHSPFPEPPRQYALPPPSPIKQPSFGNQIPIPACSLGEGGGQGEDEGQQTAPEKDSPPLEDIANRRREEFKKSPLFPLCDLCVPRGEISFSPHNRSYGLLLWQPFYHKTKPLHFTKY